MADEALIFNKDYILENDCVKLSPLKEFHIAFLEDVANDQEIWTYFFENGLEENLIPYVLLAVQNRVELKEYPFIIFDKRTKQYAGITRLYDYLPNLKSIKMGHTWIGKAFWGTQLNKNAKYLLFEFIFDNLVLERVGFGVHGENLRSVNALKGIGCTQEGVLRNFLPSLDGQSRVDLLHFSLLKQEWQDQIKSELHQQLNTTKTS